MTNLPISNANILPPGNSSAPGLPDSTEEQGETSFATLLEQQIDAAATVETEDAQTIALSTAAVDDLLLEGDKGKKPDDGNNALNIVQDPAGAMAALLLQLPDRKVSLPGELRGRGSSAFANAAEIALERASPHSRLAREALAQTGATTATPIDSRAAVPADIPKAEFAVQLQQSTTTQLQPIASEQTPVGGTSVAPSLNASDNILQATSSPLQLAPATTNAASAIDPQKTITTPLTSNHWANDFSQKINWMVSGREQTAELHLNPPDLGPLNVVLKISDNQATALFTSPHSTVRDAVENALPKLREILADNGITLGNASVSDQSHPDRGTRTPAEQDQRASAQRAGLDETPLVTTPVAPLRRHDGMVDTFA